MNTILTAPQATKLLLSEAAPFLLTRFIEVGTDFSAMVMLANLGDSELAASTLIVALQSFLRGVAATNLYSVGILAGSAIGEAKKKTETGDVEAAEVAHSEVGRLYRTGMKLALFSAPVPILISVFISPILQTCAQAAAPSDIAQDYFRAYTIAFFPSFLLTVSQQIAQAASRPWSVVAFTVLNRAITLGLAAFLIYYKNKGVSGLGYGYVAGTVVSTAAFMLYLKFRPEFSRYHLYDCRSRKSEVSGNVPQKKAPTMKMLGVGLPIAGYAIAELGSVLFLTILVGALSRQFLEIAQPSLQYTSILANLIFAFGQGAGILVSKMYGAKENENAQKIGDLAIKLGFILPVTLLFLSFVIPDELNSAFIKDKNLLPNAKWFLIVGLVASIFDALRNTAAGTSRGLADHIGSVMSRAPMLQNIFSILCINIPIALSLSLGTSLEAKGAFIGRAVAIAISSMMIWDTWLKTKKYPTAKLSLCKVFCPRILKPGRLVEEDQRINEHSLPATV